MSVIVIDNFSEQDSHGFKVVNTLKNYYDGEVYTLDLGDSSVSVEKIEDKLDEGYENVINGTWDDVSGVNISFGGGSAYDPFYSELKGFEDHVQQYYSEDIEVSLPTGNYGEIWSGISYISSSPFNWSPGAINVHTKNITDYSQHHPILTDSFANGHNDDYNVNGTSFSSPTVLGSLSTIKEKYNLTSPETRTAFEATADYFESNHKFHEGTIYPRLNFTKLKNIDGPIEIDENQQIDAAYEIFLQRQPDESGLTHWSEKFKFSEDKEDVLDNFIDGGFSNDDMFNENIPIIEYIQAHYHLFLGREADTEGLEWWVDKYTSKELEHEEVIDDLDMTPEQHYEKYGHRQQLKDIIEISEYNLHNVTENFIEVAKYNGENVNYENISEKYIDLAEIKISGVNTLSPEIVEMIV